MKDYYCYPNNNNNNIKDPSSSSSSSNNNNNNNNSHKPSLSSSSSTSIRRVRHTNEERLKLLGANLRLRLTYARLKVLHGWHNRTLTQVELLYTSSHLPRSTPILPLDSHSSPSTLLHSSSPPTSSPTSSSSSSSSQPSSDLPLKRYNNPFDNLVSASPSDQSHLLLPHKLLISTTPVRSASFPPETPIPFKSLPSDRRLSISFFPGSARSCSDDFWKSCYSPIAFTCPPRHPHDHQDHDASPIHQSRHLLISPNDHISTTVINSSPLRLSQVKHQTNSKSLRNRIYACSSSSLSSGPLSSTSMTTTAAAAAAIDETASSLEISLDDLDRINWS